LPGKDIWLFGGASLTDALMKEGLVDELWMSVHPILLGSGKQLFRGQDSRTILTLIESKTYETGLVSLRYSINKA
jgi:dihydrofolate reductase